MNTTTAVVVNSNTGTVENLFRRDKNFQYVSSGFNNDLTTTTITINFDSTQSVSRIGLVGMNWKEFDVFYNGATASNFAMSTTSATTTSKWSSNSETSMYIIATAVNCTSVSFDVKSTQNANLEKAIGYIGVSSVLVDFERTPTSKNYKPKIMPKEIVHKLSDGGQRIHTLDSKFSVSISFKHITKTFRDNLETAWSLNDSFMFTAFGTSTSWDEIFYEVIWPGSFEFYQYSTDSKTDNFSGKIKLFQVSD